MTRTSNARIAGFTYLAYIATGIAGMVLFNQATSAEGIAAKLAGIAQHTTNVGTTIVLTLLTCFAALVLGVTLYRITREQDPDLAMLALTCRVGEGVLSGIFVLATLGLLWLGTAVGENAPNTESAHALAAFLFKVQGWNTLIGATFFAVGSMLFSWLLLRGRMIPIAHCIGASRSACAGFARTSSMLKRNLTAWRPYKSRSPADYSRLAPGSFSTPGKTWIAPAGRKCVG